jgi:uncharacterized protein with FMN-binding domain
MRTLIKVVLSILIIFIIIAAGGMIYMTLGMDSGSKIKIDNVNMSGISDGAYSGKYDFGRWTNEVKVTVENHKITKIAVVKDVTFPRPGLSEQLFDKVIESQSTIIDVVSGATVTSKAYLKSIESALEK